MKQIVLDVKEENINTILTILENLKDGLIENINSDSKKVNSARYTPKSNEVVREGVKPSGKYLSKEEYQKRKVKTIN